MLDWVLYTHLCKLGYYGCNCNVIILSNPQNMKRNKQVLVYCDNIREPMCNGSRRYNWIGHTSDEVGLKYGCM